MAAFSVERGYSGYFVCVDGVKVKGPLATKYLAENALERLERKARMRERRCMTCTALFMSEGPHNRMCNVCRRENGSCGS